MIWTCPGLTDLPLIDPAAGLVCTAIDFGWPVTRTVASNRPLADGTDDDTTFMGARAVTMQFVLSAGSRTRAQNRGLLAQFCHPARRSTLKFQGDLLDPSPGEVDRMVTLRTDQGSAPVDNRFHTAVTVSAIAPSGLIEAITATVLDVPPLPAAEGAEFDWEWPVVWPETTPEPTTATSAGTMASWPTIRIDGPCTGPAVWCGAKVLSFPGFEVEAGHFLLIDSAARTVLLDGVTDRRSALDAAVSSWWQIQPGDNDVMFVPERSGSPSTVTVTWRDAFFL